MAKRTLYSLTKRYEADLGDDKQVVGNVYLRLNHQLSYRVNINYLPGVKSVRLRLGSSGGPVVTYLYGPTKSRVSPVQSSGVITAYDLRGPLRGQSVSALVKQMDKGNIWADAATKEQPYGAAVGRVYRRR